MVGLWSPDFRNIAHAGFQFGNRLREKRQGISHGSHYSSMKLIPAWATKITADGGYLSLDDLITTMTRFVAAALGWRLPVNSTGEAGT